MSARLSSICFSLCTLLSLRKVASSYVHPGLSRLWLTAKNWKVFCPLHVLLIPLLSSTQGLPGFVFREDKYGPLNALEKRISLSLNNPGIHSPQLIMLSQTTTLFPTFLFFLTLLCKLSFLPLPASGLPNPQVQDSKLCPCQILSFQLYRLFPCSPDSLPIYSK